MSPNTKTTVIGEEELGREDGQLGDTLEKYAVYGAVIGGGLVLATLFVRMVTKKTVGWSVIVAFSFLATLILVIGGFLEWQKQRVAYIHCKPDPYESPTGNNPRFRRDEQRHKAFLDEGYELKFTACLVRSGSHEIEEHTEQRCTIGYPKGAASRYVLTYCKVLYR